jgi:ATPase subunit of ABC transporter with duplicated ATPase domains
MPQVCELSRKGIALYGGNYDFYLEQKRIESTALNEDVKAQKRLCVKPGKRSVKRWSDSKDLTAGESKSKKMQG